MDRTDFFSIETVNAQKELDFLNTSISKFQMVYPAVYYRISETDWMRPDMISYAMYGTVKYWWLIVALNNIFDPFNDLVVGKKLTIPNLFDVYDFYKKYGKVR